MECGGEADPETPPTIRRGRQSEILVAEKRQKLMNYLRCPRSEAFSTRKEIAAPTKW